MVITGFGLNFNPLLIVALAWVCIIGNTQACPHAAQRQCVHLSPFLWSVPGWSFILITAHHLFNQTLIMDF